MKKVYHTSYGMVTNQYLQREDGQYTVRYTVEYEGDTYIYTANAVALIDARLLLYGIGQWYRDTVLICRPYSIGTMRYAFSTFQGDK